MAGSALAIAAWLCLTAALFAVQEPDWTDWRIPEGVEADLPLTPRAVEEALQRVAEGLRRPLGIELPVHQAQRGRTQSEYVLRLAGLPLNRALEVMASRGAAFTASRFDGTVILRPTSNQGQANNPLNYQIGTLQLRSTTAEEALYQVTRHVDPAFRPPRGPSAERFRLTAPDRFRAMQDVLERRFDANLDGLTVAQGLSRIVQQHAALWWRAHTAPGILSIEFRSFDGWGFGTDVRLGP